MSLDSIASVTITTATSAVTQEGFGVPLIAGYHDEYADTVREYSGATGLADLVADGFATNHPIYKAASYLLAQSPRPPTFKVGKLITTGKQIVEIVPVAANGRTYSIDIGSETATYVADSATSVAEICTGLTSAINTLTGAFTATDGTTKVTVTADNFDEDFVYKGYSASDLHLTDVSTPQGGTNMADALAAIVLADNDWYCLLLARQPEADIENAAAVIETLDKIFIANSPDYGIISSSTTDVASDLQDLSDDRTKICYHAAFGEHLGAAVAGCGLPLEPGSETWKFLQPSGVTASTMTTAMQGYADDKSANYLVTIAGNNVMMNGTMASGEYTDVVRFVDWLKARLQEGIFGALINNKKIPFTDHGINLIVGIIKGVLEQGVRVGGLASDPAYVVYAPKAADVSSNDKANRNLPDVSFTATLAGAVHTVTITGTVSV